MSWPPTVISVRAPAVDRKRIRAASVELPADAPRAVSHSFSFVFNPEGARALGAELRRQRFTRVWVGEEIAGDDCWHVVGWRTQSLTPRRVANGSRAMVALAREHGGEYDGWSLPPDTKLG
ncbi:MAG: ribonuclease E inhibitor RraB [Gemmatimonadota bacterium]|nr:ribonuclease E inhibitor RraB [Gemmatimonadota bacterium]